MARRPVIVRGTAREDAEAPDSGYSGTGLGFWTRNAGAGNVKMKGYVEPPPPGMGKKRKQKRPRGSRGKRLYRKSE